MAQAVTEPGLVTADEFLRIPDGGMRHELIRGEIREMPPPGEEHCDIANELAWHLGSHVRAHALGRVYGDLGYRIASDPDTVLAPDVSFVRAERLTPGKRNKGYRAGAPDLAVEVVSPTDSLAAVEEKAWEWLAAGCRMVIVVNPRNRSVMVHQSYGEPVRLTEADVLDGGDVVPGWTLPVRKLFEFGV
jgi:Uma2 family endonuclease